MRPIALLALAAGAAVGGALLAQPHVTAAPPEKPTTAVVDVFAVMSQHPRKAQIEEKNRAVEKATEDYLGSELKRIEEMRGKLRLMLPSDPGRPALAKQVAHDMAMYDFEKKWRVGEAQREYFDALGSLYDEVRAEIKNVAMSMGYSIVLAKTDDKLEVTSGNEFYLNIGVRPVLYYDKAVDLTQVVKDRIAARGGTPPPAPPAGAPAVPPAMGTPPPPPPAGTLPPPAMGGAMG